MYKNQLFFIALILSIVAVFSYIITYSQLSKQQKQNAVLLEEKASLETELRVKDEQIAEHTRLLAEAQQKLASVSTESDAHNPLPFHDAQRPKAQQELSGTPDLPSTQKQNAAPNNAIAQQTTLLFGDLPKELNLSEERSKKLMDQIAHMMKSEAEFREKIFDPNTSTDDLLRLQESLSQRFDEELSSFLNSQEREVVRDYRNNSQKIATKKRLVNIVDQLGLNDQEKEKTKVIIERAIEQSESKKNLGQYAREDIVMLREKFAGKKPGSQEFIKASIEMGEAEAQKFLQNLQGLSKEPFEQVKEHIELPFKFMRQNISGQR